MLAFLLLGVVGGLCFFGLFRWTRWSSALDVPTPTSWPERLPVFGAMLTLLTRLRDINDWLYEQTVRNGRVWSFWIVGQPRFVVTTDVDDVQHVLKDNFDNFEKGPDFHHRFVELLGDGIFNVDGDKWYTQRKTASTMFKVRNFRDSMALVFIEHTTKFLRLLGQHADAGQPVDLHAYFHKITLDSIGEIGFGVNLDSVSSTDNAFAAAFDGSQEAVNQRFLTPFWQLRKLLHPQEWRLRQSVRYLNDFTYRIVDERLADPDSCAANADLLSLFIQRGVAQQQVPTRDFLRDLVINFIIAGRDTTAQALSWMFYELMRHPHEMQAVVAEVDRVLGAQPPDYNSVKDMTYLHAAFSETLRLHPSVPKDAKMCVKDDVLPSGYHVQKGTWVIYLPYVMGRLPSIWGADCLDFKPQRFVDDPNPSQFKYPVFQAGPRICLGKDMAYLEAKIVASLLLQHFEFAPVQNQPEVTYLPSLTLQMRNGLWCSVQRRTKK